MIANTKRFVKLREHPPGLDAVQTPPDSYISTTDGTLQSKPFIVRVDRNGYIETGNDKNVSRPAILILGDSTIENYWVEEKDRVAAVLEKMLRENGKNLDVLNGGVSGAHILHSLIALLSKGLSRNLAGIFYMAGPIDNYFCSINGTYWPENAALNCVVTAEPANCPMPPAGEVRFDDRNKLLACLCAIADIHEIPIHFATFHNRKKPYNIYVDNELLWASVVKNNQAINQSTRNFCIGANREFIDIELAFSGRDDLLYDHIHMNEQGCREAAALIFSQLATSKNIVV